MRHRGCSSRRSHLVARNVMMWSKFAFGRLRPHQWHGGPSLFHGGGSFPSGHVMLFASLSLPIVVVFPRARRLLVDRRSSRRSRGSWCSAHCASDVVGGALCARSLRDQRGSAQRDRSGEVSRDERVDLELAACTSRAGRRPTRARGRAARTTAGSRARRAAAPARAARRIAACQSMSAVFAPGCIAPISAAVRSTS